MNDTPRRFRQAVTAVAMLLLAAACPPATAQPSGPASPNILLIIADDMGYGDLGCTGTAVIQTPNLDALAAEGRLCSQAYVTSSVCAPSRAGLITGRYPTRIGFEANLSRWAEDTPTRPEFYGLHPSEATLADHLRHQGYRTYAVGKWHLGYEAAHYPTARGFDHFTGTRAGSHSYFLNRGRNTIERDGEQVTEFSSPYATDFFTDEAIRYIDLAALRPEHSDREPAPPWFLYLAYNAPHTPMQATDEDLAHYQDVRNDKRRTYCAMVHALDRGVGRIVEHLKQTGQYDNTLIVFLSDNGGPRRTNASWNGPFSGSKGNLREGGIRVPMIITWPSRIPPGDTAYAGVISALDLLPTFLAACGGDPLPLNDGAGDNARPRTYDGINILDALIADQPTPNRPLFWRLQGQTAVLVDGEDKFIRLAHRPAQLFRLSDDPGEGHDLAPDDPQSVERLYRVIHDWERAMPTYPHFNTSPYWQGQSANNYDDYTPAREPR
ncbi:MAG: sulfatase-like hydrolase/transferase [Phycisphaerales bacterium JB063]